MAPMTNWRRKFLLDQTFKTLKKISDKWCSAWWFGNVWNMFIFPSIGNNNPKWPSWIFRGLKPATRVCLAINDDWWHIQKTTCFVLQGSKSSHLWKDMLPSAENPFCWPGFLDLRSTWYDIKFSNDIQCIACSCYMYPYIPVCIYIYIHVHTYTIHMNVYIYNICIHTYTYTLIHMCIYLLDICTYIYIHVCIQCIYSVCPSRALEPGWWIDTGLGHLLFWDEHVVFLHSIGLQEFLGILWSGFRLLECKRISLGFKWSDKFVRITPLRPHPCLND